MRQNLSYPVRATSKMGSVVIFTGPTTGKCVKSYFDANCLGDGDLEGTVSNDWIPVTDTEHWVYVEEVK